VTINIKRTPLLAKEGAGGGLIKIKFDIVIKFLTKTKNLTPKLLTPKMQLFHPK